MYVYILVDKFNMMIRINVRFLIQLVEKQYFKMCVICVIWTQQTFFAFVVLCGGFMSSSKTNLNKYVVNKVCT